jgi:1,4-alpha-glucan branching enzyme
MIDILGAGWVRFVFEQPVELGVHLVGDFNGWDEISHPMERRGDGTHQIILKLAAGEYEFKYRSGCAWFNDAAAHKYVGNCWGSENSVIVVPSYEDQEEQALPPLPEAHRRLASNSGGGTLHPGN